MTVAQLVPDVLTAAGGGRGEGPVLRRLHPADRAQIGALFLRLSPRSRYLRYLAPVRRLSGRSLEHLAGIDHLRHEAVGVFESGALVGAAHYFRPADDADTAEICLEVADSHQRRGLGARLLAELGRLARCRGITEFTATALAENAALLGLLHHFDRPAAIGRDGAEITVVVRLCD